MRCCPINRRIITKTKCKFPITKGSKALFNSKSLQILKVISILGLRRLKVSAFWLRGKGWNKLESIRAAFEISGHNQQSNSPRQMDYKYEASASYRRHSYDRCPRAARSKGHRFKHETSTRIGWRIKRRRSMEKSWWDNKQTLPQVVFWSWYSYYCSIGSYWRQSCKKATKKEARRQRGTFRNKERTRDARCNLGPGRTWYFTAKGSFLGITT